ncbi:NADH-quinone oxidoreductase subunit M [Thermotomaculum hydrothermale]|uniref:NADH-quinone oxidoreductase subunit M n=1 Tax=Thermotomaculum hydrothermale TaxID=981385 RepID=A0A7R6PR16_9BACT|nr:NADH-quinone oxidoreductase subunit M [Thermotomaculum hydrothermale]BBB32771.1 NADH-quinone oxidoreductase subunit M [Thermotomaculum hydrothermale]
MFENHFLSLITFFPLLAVVILLFFPSKEEKGIKVFGIVFSLIHFLISLKLLLNFDYSVYKLQFVERTSWIVSNFLNSQYFIGIDGISLFIVLLTTFLMPIIFLSTYSGITKKVKSFYIHMFLLEVGILGSLVALDLFLFYVFWEVMLIPMYFIIGVWGGERRIYAAIKFFIYTMAGSLLMLLGIMYIYKTTGTFDVTKIYSYHFSLNEQIYLFIAFAIAFAIKVPIFPFHTWLPDAHTEAPTAGSVILAGVLLKLGTYGYLRFAMPMFPDAMVKFAPYVIVLAIIGIIYGALVAMVQKDIKKLVAYSSVSHLGYVMLGLFALTVYGMQGGILQMINHGISTGALFLLVGVVYERKHTRLISEYGGIAKVMPVYATFFMIVTLSSIGLPLTNGFVGEFSILLGTFKSSWQHAWVYTAFAASGVILGAVYMLWMYQRVFFNTEPSEENKKLTDLTKREIAYLVPLVIMIFWIGLYPNFFFKRMQKSVDYYLNMFKAKQVVTVIDNEGGKK